MDANWWRCAAWPSGIAALLIAAFAGCTPPPTEGPLFRAGRDNVVVAMDGGEAGGAAQMPGDLGQGSVGGAGGVGAADASTSDAPAAPSAFLGVAPFASQPVATSARAQMTTSGTNPTRTACLTCHTSGASAASSALLAGGTIFLDAAGANAAADVEVRIIDLPTMNTFDAHTDADGNFWIAAPKTAPVGPFRVGIRGATSEMTMPIEQRALDCSGSACHGGGQGPVHLQ